jgi:hypothetical protein
MAFGHGVGSIPVSPGADHGAQLRAARRVHPLRLGARQLRDSRMPIRAVLSGSPAVETPKNIGTCPSRGALLYLMLL